MRSASEDQILLDQSKSDDDIPHFLKEPKQSYTRNFLLSLSELDSCKSLPCGFDQSILGEIPDSRIGLFHPCQGSDSRRFHGHLSRHSSPNPEHGLLGSGAFPRVSSISGDSASLVQGKGYHLLNRSNAAYQPPHRCKDKVYSTTESEDLNNNETFGSSDLLNLNRAGDERRRKEMFELMRKEQHRTLQVKQNKMCDEYKENLDPEVAETLEASGNFKSPVIKHTQPDENATSLSPVNDPARLDFNAQSSAENLPPLVNKSPNFGTKSLINSSISEPCDVRRDHMEGYSFHSSDSAHQFLEETKPGYISSKELEGGTVWNEKLARHNSTNLSSGGYELAPKLIASTSTSDTNGISEQLYNCYTPNVPSGVRTGEDFEVSMPFELNEYYLTQHHSVKGCQPYDRKGRQPNSVAEYGASRQLLSFLEEPDQTDIETFSKPNMGSLDKFLVPEIGDNGFAKDAQTTECADIRAHSPVSISDGSQTNIRYNLGSESESKLSPVSGFDESADTIDEICLPDEDSLITVDDFIFPQDTTFPADSGSVKSDLFTSNPQVDNADELEALSLTRGEEIYTQLALDGPIFDSYDVTGLATSYRSMLSQQSFSSFGQHQINPVKAFFRSADAQEVHMNHKTRPLDSNSKTYLYKPQPLHLFPINMQADLRRFAHPIHSPPLQQMPIPSKSPHQVCLLPRGSPSPHSSNEINCYTQEVLYPTQNLPLCYGQQHLQGLDMPIADHIAGGISEKVATYNRLFEMEVRSSQAHPLALAGHGRNSEIFGKQVGMGFWYGK